MDLVAEIKFAGDIIMNHIIDFLLLQLDLTLPKHPNKDSAWLLVKPSPPNFVRPLFFSHFMNSNLHVFVSRFVMAKKSQYMSQIHINLNS
jgi:hypothetical protein